MLDNVSLCKVNASIWTKRLGTKAVFSMLAVEISHGDFCDLADALEYFGLLFGPCFDVSHTVDDETGDYENDFIDISCTNFYLNVNGDRVLFRHYYNVEGDVTETYITYPNRLLRLDDLATELAFSLCSGDEQTENVRLARLLATYVSDLRLYAHSSERLTKVAHVMREGLRASDIREYVVVPHYDPYSRLIDCHAGIDEIPF